MQLQGVNSLQLMYIATLRCNRIYRYYLATYDNGNIDNSICYLTDSVLKFVRSTLINILILTTESLDTGHQQNGSVLALSRQNCTRDYNKKLD